MAVAPITQPTAAGIDPVDYSPWSQAAQARSATPGILNYVPNANPLPAPTASPSWQGGSVYGNYVRQWPDLLAAFQNPNQPQGMSNIQDWGKWHWLTHGQANPNRRPGPSDLPANPAISLGDTMDTGGTSTRVGTSGLPMPDVEGYKYVYPAYEWDHDQNQYVKLGAMFQDIDKYPYMPYLPSSGGQMKDDEGNEIERILVGISLVPDSWVDSTV